MQRNRHLLSLLAAALLAAPVATAEAQPPKDKPVTVEQVGKNVESESKRVANRTGKVTRKAAKQTEAQAKRSANATKKLWSRKARQEGKVDNHGQRVSAVATTNGAVARYQSNGSVASDKPLTVEQVAKNTESESKRVANRTGKAVRKALKQTEKQAKRTVKQGERAVSREERRNP